VGLDMLAGIPAGQLEATVAMGVDMFCGMMM